jgi:hypothetical protein
MSRVMRCMCEECHYNEKHECHAEGIEVKSSGDMKVETTDGTCCNTFRPRTGRG